MIDKIIKRDGTIVDFNKAKISNAIWKAAKSVGEKNKVIAEKLADKVVMELEEKFKDTLPTVEDVQDIVEKVLIEGGYVKIAKAYIIYRVMHAKLRELRGKRYIKGYVSEPVSIEFNEEEAIDYLKKKCPPIAEMFLSDTKMKKIIDIDLYKSYLRTYYIMKKKFDEGKLKKHKDNNYLGSNELAENIYKNKYFLKDLKGNLIETRPEETFLRISSFVASTEETFENQEYYAENFYDCLYNGYFLPGGRVIAGAGDLFRVKTLANCFAAEIESDTIEAIYKAAYCCARTYSYGGGIGVDVSVLRPKNSVVHNASFHSTGSVSFMDLFSLTTGLIGQEGRRGALMITIDVKHPDVFDFILCKTKNNWVTNQIVLQASWSGIFNDKQLKEIEKIVRENTQIRFANISVKMNDEFLQAVEEQIKYGKNKFIVYKQVKEESIQTKQDFINIHYSRGYPSKDISNYKLIAVLDNEDGVVEYLSDYGIRINKEELMDVNKRNAFGDYIVNLKNKGYEFNLAIRQAGDFILYFNQDETGEIKRLVKARDIWNLFVESNYRTAEPGVIFWNTMRKYSPSNYIGVPIITTNPCSEVPLENGGACNLLSLNLARFVVNPYEKNARVDWRLLEKVTYIAVRFLDNVVTWNEKLNPLKEQRTAAGLTRRVGLGIMGIADMLNMLGVGFDSEKGLEIIKEVMKFICNVAYQASSHLAKEKGTFPLFNFEKYSKGRFFQEALTKDTQKLIKKYGIRNVALLSIAPTGTISNIVLSYVDEKTGNHYVGVSSGIEPIFSLYYTRRSESFGNKRFRIFHSTVQAYIDKNDLQDKIEAINDLDELKKVLPDYFFRTAHFINPKKRIELQAICQKYVDHSISSTINLPESTDPETISDIYLYAWKKGLKGVTIYRDGSRYPILEIQKQQTEFQKLKDKVFVIEFEGKTIEARGDDVIVINDKLTTPFHLLKNKVKDIKIYEKKEDSLIEVEKPMVFNPKGSSGACKIEFGDGKLIKTCDE